jgi:uncharacterized membrane protein
VSDPRDLARLTGPDRRTPGVGIVPIAIGLVVLTGLIVLWPRGEIETDLGHFGFTDEVYRAEVTDAVERGCSFGQDCVVVTFELLEGPTPGTVDVKEYGLFPGTPEFEPGQRVLLGYIADGEATAQYKFADFERRPVLWAVGLVLALAVAGLGRMRGPAALVGLLVGVGILVWFIVPAILHGWSPVLVAVVGASAIGLLALYVAHGVNPLTDVALIGTFLALVLTVLRSAASVALAGFTGFTGEDGFILTLAGNADVRGLVPAGVALGALGALDGVTVTQASSVWELRRANPDLTVTQLAAAGLRVGRDHIASAVNTLLLAYAGASKPRLLRLAPTDQPGGIILNSEIVATEIVRTLVGSIGLVAAVPITTRLAAVVARRLPSVEHAH